MTRRPTAPWWYLWSRWSICQRFRPGCSCPDQAANRGATANTMLFSEDVHDQFTGLKDTSVTYGLGWRRRVTLATSGPSPLQTYRWPTADQHAYRVVSTSTTTPAWCCSPIPRTRLSLTTRSTLRLCGNHFLTGGYGVS